MTTVDGGNSPFDVTAGQTATDDVVVGGGAMAAPSEGIADAASVGAGGALTVEAAGSGTLVSGGSEIVSSGGSNADAPIGGGALDMFEAASGATIAGGAQFVEPRGNAQDTALDTGNALAAAGAGADENAGLASGTVVDGGGTELAERGGLPVGAGGGNADLEYVSAGMPAASAIVAAGGEYLAETESGNTALAGGDPPGPSSGAESGTVVDDGGFVYGSSGQNRQTDLDISSGG